MTTTGKSSLIASKKRKGPNRYHIQRFSRSTLIYVVLLIFCAIIILPVGWMLTVALKPDRLPVFTIPPEWYPIEHWEWNNFSRVLTATNRPFFRYALNTMVIILGNLAGTLISCSLVGFAFSRLLSAGCFIALHLVRQSFIEPPRASRRNVATI